jgi:predicted ATPase
MIARIEIAGFKRFTASCFELASLVVLCGLNGAGKSSMLQALLLCREAMTSQAKTVSLNGGPFGLELGTAEDVHNRASVGNISIRMMTADDPTVAQWRFAVPESTPDSLYLVVAERPDPFGEAFVLDAVPRGFTYLSAERFGPRALLKSAATAGSMLEVGVRGEFSAQVLAEFGERPLEYLDRRHPNAAMDAVPFLKYELEQWLSEIVCPIRVEPELHANGLVASLRFGPPGSDLVRAPNMGFGISYALPIILAGLGA